MKNVNRTGMRFLFAIALCAAGLSAQSQNNSRVFRHVTPRDGLINGFVWKILQDRHGFIWVAGNAGLDKLEGTGIVNYRHSGIDPQSIPRGQVRDIMEMPDGSIWVAAHKLAVLDPGKGTFKTVHFPDSVPGFEVGWTLLRTDNGDIWAGANSGLYRIPIQDLSADTLEVEYYAPQLSQSERFALRSLAEGEGGLLWVGTNGGLFRFDTDRKRFMEPGSFGLEADAVIQGNIWSILHDRGGNLWIGSDSGLAIWRAGQETPAIFTVPGEGKTSGRSLSWVQGISEDDAGKIWIGTGLAGAYCVLPETEEVMSFSHKPGNLNSLVEDDVHYVLKDRDGNLWFGYHYNGLSLMYEESWNYSFTPLMAGKPASDLVNTANNVLQDPDGNLWLTTRMGLVLHPSGGGPAQQFLPFTGQNQGEENNLSDIAWFDDKLLIVTSQGKVLVFDCRGRRFTPIAVPESVSGPLYSVLETDNRFYIGALNYGMLQIDKASFDVSYYPNPYNDRDSSVRKSLEPYLDASGNILVLAFDFPQVDHWEIYLFNPENQSFTPTGAESPPGLIWPGPPCISPTQPGVFTAISDVGIVRLDVYKNEFDIYFRNVIPSIFSFQYGIVEDRNGRLYVAGRDGIRVFDPNTGFYSFFQGREGQRPEAYLHPKVMPDGELIVTGVGGYVRFNPDFLFDRGEIRDVFITGIRSGDEIRSPLYDAMESLRLDHRTNNLFISFVALNYRDPEGTQYRYKILGYEDEWVEVGRQQQVFFANLPAGDFVFQLQASGRGQGFSESTAELYFSVLPPWWKTKFAYAAYAALLLGGLVTVDRVQRRRLVAREREHAREHELAQAKEIEKAYTELKATQQQLIHSEKMASLGELTAGIAHEIQNPLNFVNNFAEVSEELLDEMEDELDKGDATEARARSADIRQNLHKIIHHGRRADSIVKGMLQHSRSGSGQKEPTDINALADEYLRLSYHGLRAKDKSFNAEFKAELDPELLMINAVPQEIGRVLLNLINNAFYAVDQKARQGIPGYRPEVVVSTRNGQVKSGKKSIEIVVSDNGNGVPDSVKEKIFQPFFTTKPAGAGTGLGLSLSYEIITKGHAGELTLDTRTGEGTSFVVLLPVTNNSQ